MPERSSVEPYLETGRYSAQAVDVVGREYPEVFRSEERPEVGGGAAVVGGDDDRRRLGRRTR